MRALLSLLWKRLRTFWQAIRPTPSGGASVQPESPRQRPSTRPGCTLRMPRALLEQMRADLHRPHAFAAERVGFLLARKDESADGSLLLAWHYEPLQEDEYLQDPCVGARINRQAIRRMLGHALAGESVFHVHLHEHRGVPGFSSVDEENLQDLIPSFCATAAQTPHGALLLSKDAGVAKYWRAGQDGARPVSRITIVGSPLRCWEASA